MSLLDKAPRVNNCCFFINLRTGAKIISVLDIIFWTIMFALQIIWIVGVPLLVEVAKKEANEHGKVITPSELAALASFLYVVAAVWISISIPCWIFCICLYIGVFKQNSELLKVWLWFELIMIVVSISFDIYCMAKTDMSSGGIFFEILIIGLRIYWFLSINSYRMAYEQGQFRPYERNVNTEHVESAYPTLQATYALPKK